MKFEDLRIGMIVEGYKDKFILTNIIKIEDCCNYITLRNVNKNEYIAMKEKDFESIKKVYSNPYEEKDFASRLIYEKPVDFIKGNIYKSRSNIYYIYSHEGNCNGVKGYCFYNNLKDCVTDDTSKCVRFTCNEVKFYKFEPTNKKIIIEDIKEEK